MNSLILDSFFYLEIVSLSGHHSMRNPWSQDYRVWPLDVGILIGNAYETLIWLEYNILHLCLFSANSLSCSHFVSLQLVCFSFFVACQSLRKDSSLLHEIVVLKAQDVEASWRWSKSERGKRHVNGSTNLNHFGTHLFYRK